MTTTWDHLDHDPTSLAERANQPQPRTATPGEDPLTAALTAYLAALRTAHDALADLASHLCG